MSLQLTKKTKGHRQQGFSLIEVLISVVVISLGLLSLANFQTRGVTNSTAAYTQTQSMLHLQELVELLRVNKEIAAQGNYNIGLSAFADISSGPTLAETDRYNWFNNLDTVLPGAKASINCNINYQCVLELQYVFLGNTQQQSLAVIL